MTGEAPAAPTPLTTPPKLALVCDGLTVHDRHGAVRLDNFTLEIRPGEIVGLAGVEGNGQSELGMVLAGLLRPTEGRFYIGGTDLTHAGAAAVTAAGGGIVPEDRHAVACVTGMSVAENMFLNKLDRFTRFGLLQRGALNAATQKQMREFDVRAAGPDVAFSGLCGGNQQKAVLARELTLDPLVTLVAAQPTRGLDVSAVEAVYRQIRAAARRGVGVLLISSELDELIARGRPHRRALSRPAGRRASCRNERARRDRRPDVGAGRMTALALSLPDRRRLLGMAVPFIAVVGSMILGLLLIALSGKDVPDAIEAFMDGAFGNAFAIGASINRAVALSLVGLGFILAFRANLTNVGGEGQIAVGGIAATALGLWPPIANLPLGLAVLVPLLGGTLAGAFWGGIAGFMKVRFGTNEVISTLLLGFVALLVVYWCVQSTALLRQPQTSSATLPESLAIAELGQAAGPDRQFRIAAAHRPGDLPAAGGRHGDRPATLDLRPAAARDRPERAGGATRRHAGRHPAGGGARHRRRLRRAGRRHHAAGRAVLPEDRLLLGLRLRRPGGRPAVARLDASACWRVRCSSASCARAASQWRSWPACRRR